jgi:putative FmdB family regulatory protein
MPIYEFECRACQNVWDALQKISDPDPASCPSCHKAEVQRRMTAAAFRLKGAGWYETDFKKEGDTKRNLVEGSAPAEAKTESTESTKPSESPSTASTTPAASASSAPAPVSGA